MKLRSLGTRAGRTPAVVGVSVVGISSRAPANSGQWCNTVGVWVHWSA